MLAEIDGSAWTILGTVLIFSGFGLGWIADTILEELGFGLLLVTVVAGSLDCDALRFERIGPRNF